MVVFDSDAQNTTCPHIKDAISLENIEGPIEKLSSNLQCETCSGGNTKETDNLSMKTSNSSGSEHTLVDDSSPNTEPDPISARSLLLCLSCGQLNCGRDDSKHALAHYGESKEHFIAINIKTFDVWCYACDDNPSNLTEDQSQTIDKVQSLIREASESKDIEIEAPGLQNLGNTCFFNSLMQVVAATSVLHDILDPSNPYYNPPLVSYKKCPAATSEDVGPLTDNFKSFLDMMWKQHDGTVNPKNLFQEISRKWQQFRGWRQQDSQEVMRYLFDGIKIDEISSQGSINQKEKDKSSVQKYESFIDACFGGKLVSVIVCDTCDNKYTNESTTYYSTYDSRYGSRDDNSSPHSSGGDADIGDDGDAIVESDDNDGQQKKFDNETKPSAKSIKQNDISLIDCLNSFMRVETLEVEETDDMIIIRTTPDHNKHEPNDAEDSLNRGGNNDYNKVEETDDMIISQTTPDHNKHEPNDAEDSLNRGGNNDYNGDGTVNGEEEVEGSDDKMIIKKFKLQKAYKRYLFASLPPVLVFHLKRFQQVGSRWSMHMKKIDDFVSFEEEIDVGEFVVPPEIEEDEEEESDGTDADDDSNNNYKRYKADEISNDDQVEDDDAKDLKKQQQQNKLIEQPSQSTKYRLYGVVVHLGSLFNGHYIAFVLSRNIVGEGEQTGLPNLSYDDRRTVNEIHKQAVKTGDGHRQWIYCSDSSVRSATVEEALSSGPRNTRQLSEEIPNYTEKLRSVSFLKKGILNGMKANKFIIKKYSHEEKDYLWYINNEKVKSENYRELKTPEEVKRIVEARIKEREYLDIKNPRKISLENIEMVM
ncbi:18070_t:CDS:10 [Entrophospora sp. SA101]|nr:18070_t:CDS:10 [Entrophospora sp. SA101]